MATAQTTQIARAQSLRKAAITTPEAQWYPNHIRIQLPKQCILILTHEEYLRGLSRGKAVKRHAQHIKRARKAPEARP